MSRGPFEKRVVIRLSAIAGASLVAFLLLMFFGADLGGVRSAGSDAYSRSAVGHMAFVGLLERLGVTVTLSRFKSGDKARDEVVLIIAEPHLSASDDDPGEEVRRMIDLVDRTILILPKRSSLEDPKKPGWITKAPVIPRGAVEEVMEAAGIKGDLVRVKPDELPPVFKGGMIAGRPRVAEVQLIHSTELTPLVTCARGMLVGEIAVEDRRLIVITDPDLVSTHGLADGDNAVIAAATVFDLLGDDRTVFFDETLHGHELPPNIWGAMFVFPLSLATAQVLLVLVLLVWAALGRFGAALPPVDGAEHGKALLIANTADLLVNGGHTGSVLERYFSTTARDLARVFNAPAGLSKTQTLDWLTAIGEKRGVGRDLMDLRAQVREIARGEKKAERLSVVAMKIHRYKKEILYGS